MNVDKFIIILYKTNMSATPRKLNLHNLRELAAKPTDDDQWSLVLKKLWNGDIEEDFEECKLKVLMASLIKSAVNISNFGSRPDVDSDSDEESDSDQELESDEESDSDQELESDEDIEIHQAYIKSMREFLEAEGITDQGVVFESTQYMNGNSPDWDVRIKGVKSIHQAIVWLLLFQIFLPKELEDKIRLDFSCFRGI